MKNTLKSIGAVLAGFLFIGVTHTGMDTILESAGILPKGHLYVNTGLLTSALFFDRGLKLHF